MARCPECGKWIWRSVRVRGELVCDECGAVLWRKESLGGYLLGSLEVVGHISDRYWEEDDLRPSLSRAEAIERYERDRCQREEPKTTEDEPLFRGDKATWAHCKYCEAIIVLSNAKFCSNCGASLRYGLKDATPLGMEDKAKTEAGLGTVRQNDEECMVCNLELNEDDNLVWCPHCGNPAHRTHLLEWIHTRPVCPICGEHLSEQELR